MVPKGDTMTTFKTLTIKKLDNGYEELSYKDNKFFKKFITTDEWWNLKTLPSNHDRFELKSYINQLEVYSEEHRNPPVVEFLISVRPVKLQLAPFYETHEDHSKVLHLNDIICPILHIPSIHWITRIVLLYHLLYLLHIQHIYNHHV